MNRLLNSLQLLASMEAQAGQPNWSSHFYEKAIGDDVQGQLNVQRRREHVKDIRVQQEASDP